MESLTQTRLATEPHAPCQVCGVRPPRVGRPLLGALLLIGLALWGVSQAFGPRLSPFHPARPLFIIGACISLMFISGCGLRAPLRQLAALLADQPVDLSELRAALRITIVAGPL